MTDALRVLAEGEPVPEGAIAVPPGVLCFILPPHPITGSLAQLTEEALIEAARRRQHVLFQEPGWQVIVVPQPPSVPDVAALDRQADAVG